LLMLCLILFSQVQLFIQTSQTIPYLLLSNASIQFFTLSCCNIV
jgi:hypothetical protein